MLVLHR